MSRRPPTALALVLALLACDTPPSTAPASPAPDLAIIARPVQAAVGETFVSKVYDWRFSPNRFTVAMGTTVLWDFVGPKGHMVDDESGLQLYDTGSEGGAGRPGYQFSYRFTVAGGYPFDCTAHTGIMKGAIEVPMQITPVSSILGTTYNVTWASEPIASGFVVDVQIKRPGTTTFSSFLSGRTDQGSAWTPTGPGTYEFRSRLRKVSNGVAGPWSPAATAIVAAAGTTNPVPVANFAYSCSGLRCGFTDASADADGTIAAWSWSLGDGTLATVAQPFRTYASSQPYRVTLSVTDGGGTLSAARAIDLVPFNDPANPVFSYACSGLACTFTDASYDVDGTVTGWSWTFGDGTSASTRNPSHTYAAAGTYKVVLQPRDNGGLWGGRDTLALILTASNIGPVPLFTYECVYLACTFTDLSSDADGQVTAWEWDFADGTSSNERNPTHAYARNGDYLVGLRVTDDKGTKSSPFSKLIRPRAASDPTNAAPVAGFTWSCTAAKACTLDGSPSTDDVGVVSYEWYRGTYRVATGKVVTLQLASGTRDFTLLVADGSGLTGTMTQAVTVP